MNSIKNSILMVVRGILIFFLFSFSFVFQYIPILMFNIDTKTIINNTRILVLFSVLSDAILLFLLLIVYHKDLKRDWIIFKKNITNNIGISLLYWFIGITIMFTANIVLFLVFKSQASNNEQLVRSFINSFPIIMGINVCFVAPIVEEIVFRKTLKDIFHNKWIFAIISFFLFGGAHVVRSATSLVDYLYIIPYGVMGFMFALADYKTDTVCTSMFSHILHNTLTFIMIIFI